MSKTIISHSSNIDFDKQCENFQIQFCQTFLDTNMPDTEKHIKYLVTSVTKIIVQIVKRLKSELDVKDIVYK